jgi:hypothetical protein
VSVTDRIIARCSRPEGCDRSTLVAQFRQYQRQIVRQRIDEMVAGGELLRFTRRTSNGRGRDSQQYFTDAADGQRWAAATVIEPRQSNVRKAARKKADYKPVPLVISKPKGEAAVFASAPAVVPAGLKPTVLPGMPKFDARYQVDPSTRVAGGFASAGIGRYLDTQP